MTPPKTGMFVAFCLLACWATVARAEMMPGAIGNDGANGFDGSISAEAFSSIGSNNREPLAAVNGAGLSANGFHDADEYGREVTWLSASGSGTGHFAVNLGEAYVLDYLKFWNFQGTSTNSDRGVQTADIYVSTAETPTDYDFANNTQWTLLIDNQTFTRAPASATVDFSDTIDLGNTTTRWLAFDIQSNYGGSYTGISEIQFFGTVVPEPSTWILSLLAIGAALIVGRLR